MEYKISLTSGNSTDKQPTHSATEGGLLGGKPL